MAKVDKIKEEIGLLKQLMIFSFSGGLASIGWIAVSDLPIRLKMILLLVVAIMLVLVVVLNDRIRTKIDEL